MLYLIVKTSLFALEMLYASFVQMPVARFSTRAIAVYLQLYNPVKKNITAKEVLGRYVMNLSHLQEFPFLNCKNCLDWPVRLQCIMAESQKG